MQRDVAGQPVERFDQFEQHLKSFLGEPGGPQFGQVTQRSPGVPGADVRERLGDRVHLGGRQ